MKPFRLTIYPAIEKDFRCKEFDFNTKEEMLAATSIAADLLLFIQDELQAMPDYSNSFTQYELIDGDWEEIEEE